MIRALVVILGLLLGLVLALGLGGQVGHLRAAGLAPGWMAGLADEAGLRAGRGEVAGAQLRWRFHGVDALGPHWAAQIDGDDWQVRAMVRADLTGLWFQSVEGLVPGSLLAVGGLGLIAVQEGALLLWLPSPMWFEGHLSGVARGLHLGAVQAEGPVTLTVAYGEWSR